MDCEIEPENDHKKYAVAIKNKDGVLVGHVPITSFCHNMGKLRPSVLAADLILGQGKGLELPIDFRLVGNACYLRKVIIKLQKEQKRKDADWRISDLRKSDMQD